MKFFRIPKLEDDTVEIKLKFKEKAYQRHPGISEHACYAYWKLGSGFFWKKAGIIERQRNGNPVDMLSEDHRERLLKQAHELVSNIINDDREKYSLRLSIPVREIVK